MRSKLGELQGQTCVFTASVGKVCNCIGKKKDTVLLSNLYSEDGVFLTDHTWIPLTREMAYTFDRIPLGATIVFQATVGEYTKKCGDRDYGLEAVILYD